MNMKHLVFGVIGCGRMGGAMLEGLKKSGLFAPEHIIAADARADVSHELGERLGIRAARDNREVARESDFLLLSVLPQVYDAVLRDIAPEIKPGACVITIAPNYTLSMTEQVLGAEVKLVRAMPNTPAMIGAGMTAVCRNKNVDDETFSAARAILGSLGAVEEIPENCFGAAVGIAGSAPAYVFMFIEALADAGVLGGLHREQAIRFAAQAVFGSAKLQIETGTHPEVLKDMVCSPAGTTIEAVAALEKAGFRHAVIQAARAASDKATGMK